MATAEKQDTTGSKGKGRTSNEEVLDAIKALRKDLDEDIDNLRSEVRSKDNVRPFSRKERQERKEDVKEGVKEAAEEGPKTVFQKGWNGVKWVAHEVNPINVKDANRDHAKGFVVGVATGVAGTLGAARLSDTVSDAVLSTITP